MAEFYSNENFPLGVVEALRQLGHDVRTSLEAGKANQSIPDDEVLKFAAAEKRVLLTLNRKDFIKLDRADRRTARWHRRLHAGRGSRRTG